MFKKEKSGKTNKNPLGGGEIIGFSFYFSNSYCFITFFKNKNSNKQL